MLSALNIGQKEAPLSCTIPATLLLCFAICLKRNNSEEAPVVKKDTVQAVVTMSDGVMVEAEEQSRSTCTQR